MIEGGCLCGAVRFRLASEPFDARWCHCRTCQLNSGSPAMAFASVAIADYVIVKGDDRVGTVRSSSFGHRCFCRDCGTPLYMEDDVAATTRDVSLATLDNPDAFPPGFHIFYASRIPWAEPADGLPRHDCFRPDTRGLT